MIKNFIVHLFGGFTKDDVVDIIEQTKNNHPMKVDLRNVNESDELVDIVKWNHSIKTSQYFWSNDTEDCVDELKRQFAKAFSEFLVDKMDVSCEVDLNNLDVVHTATIDIVNNKSEFRVPFYAFKNKKGGF